MAGIGDTVGRETALPCKGLEGIRGKEGKTEKCGLKNIKETSLRGREEKGKALCPVPPTLQTIWWLDMQPLGAPVP